MSNGTELIKRNIAIILLLYAVSGITFWYGIEKLYLTKQLHFSPSIIAYIIIVYGLVQVLLNVPTGALADKWSRKGMIISSLVILFIADIVLGTSTTVAQYLFGTFLWGLYFVCITGSDESILYDTLLQLNRPKDYKKIFGRASALYMVSIFIASLLSGVIAHYYGLKATYFFSLITVGLSIIISFYLIEPTAHKHQQSTSALLHLKSALGTIKKSPILMQIVLMGTVLFLLQTAYYEYAQLYYIALFGASAVAVGMLNGLGSLSIAIGYSKPRIVKYISYGFLAMGVLLLLAMAPSNRYVQILLFLVYGALFGAMSTHVNDLKHTYTPSKVRATVSSVLTTVDFVIVIPLALLFSKVIEIYSIYWAYTAIAILSLGYGLYYLWATRGESILDK